MEKYYKYAPSASEILKQKGMVVEESYYLAEGNITFEGEIAFPCTFEVGYMQDGSAWAVVYIELPESKTFLGNRETNEVIRKPVVRLSGTEPIWGRTVNVTVSHQTSRKGSPLFGANGLRIIFSVLRYEVTYQEDETSTSRFFYIANLPIHSMYSPEESVKSDEREIAEKANSAALNAAIDTSIQLATSSPDAEMIRAKALEAADLAKKDAIGDDFYYHKFISIQSGENTLAKIYWKKSKSKTLYPLEPMCILRIYRDKLPPAWNIEVAADWICALISLAIGYDIQWLHWCKPFQERGLPVNYEVWRSTQVSLKEFTPLIEQEYEAYRIQQFGISENLYEETIKFISITIFELLNQEMNLTLKYLDSLNSYVNYASTPVPNDEFECTLLCILGEYIYKQWKDVEHKKYNLPSEEKKKRKVLLQAIRNAISAQEVKNIVLPPETEEKENTYLERWQKFVDAIQSKFAKSIGYTLLDELKWFFESNDYPIDYCFEKRLRDFVNSRNALAHEHCFHSDRENQPHELYDEIRNIRGMIPLMFAIILKYRGRYWDVYEQSLRWLR